MILVLFYSEDLRTFIIDCVRNTDPLRRGLRISGAPAVDRVGKESKAPFKKALAALVADGVLSPQESTDIVALVEYRNHIAHRIYILTGDIGRTLMSRDHVEYRQEGDPRYDYDALKRIRSYRSLVHERARSHYVMTLTGAPLLFESAEKTFEGELRRLRRKITDQISRRRQKDATIRAELSLKGTEFTDAWHPDHPENQYESGRLTKRGVEICYRLFDAGKSPLAVAYLMHISLRAARKRQGQWRTLHTS